MKNAVYAGSFDPPHLGHFWVIQTASRIFDHVTVAISQNADKQAWFPAAERQAMIQEVLRGFPNVSIEVMENEFLVDFCRARDARLYIRGMRSTVDFEYEKTMSHLNSDFDQELTTIFLITPRELIDVSSSLIRGLTKSIRWEERTRNLLPQHVFLEVLLREHPIWKNLTEAGADLSAKERFIEDIIEPYLAPDRFHHDLEHILSMLREFYRIRHLFKNPLAAEYAIWGHDCHYDTHASDNELQSARICREFIEYSGLPPSLAEATDKLIAATKHNDPKLTGDAALIADLDLMILGQDRAAFDHYELGIRREYEWVPLSVFQQKRAEILYSFVTRPHIYMTDLFRTRFEKPARGNLIHSIVKMGY
jgi:pantetheine-phosphate adenylyltransferase